MRTFRWVEMGNSGADALNLTEIRYRAMLDDRYLDRSIEQMRRILRRIYAGEIRRGCDSGDCPN